MSRYIAAYDISSNRRRRRVARALRNWGERVQQSVFEVTIDADRMGDFQLDLGLLLGPDDAFDLFPLDTRDPSRRKRWRKPIHHQPVIILA